MAAGDSASGDGLEGAWASFALAWADDEILLSHQLGEMLAGWSEVEDLIALGSISQDDLAHATLLYSQLEPEPRERDRLFFERPPERFRNSRLAALVSDDWSVVIARQYLYELGDELRIEALPALSPPAPLADLGVGIAPEEAAHREHWAQWCRTLARTGEGRERLGRGLAKAWAASGDLLALPSECAELPWPRKELEGCWRQRVRADFAGLGVATPDRDPPAPRIARAGKQPQAMLATIERSRRVYATDTEAVWG